MLDIFVARFVAMASPCEVVLSASDEREAQHHAQVAVTEVRRIERKYSRYLADSALQAINTARGDWAEVDAETASLLDFAAQMYALSDGLFDATSGVLRRAWDFRTQRVPSQAEIDAVLPCIGWHHVQRRTDAVRLPVSGMELDFGGFGKEYAADRAAAALVDLGVVHGFVNLGGDVRAMGPQLDGSPWRVGIQHPDHPQRLIASIPLSIGGLATSGDYERYILHEGRRYCHVLNPKTGWPVSFWGSVSALAPVVTAAGALTTIAMLKERDAPAWLDAQQVPYLAVDTTRNIVTQKIEGQYPEEPRKTPTSGRLIGVL